MTCMYCKGKLTKKTAPFSIDRNGCYVHWHTLPAWVCTQCGEAHFEKEETDKIQRVLRAIDSEMQSSAKVAVEREQSDGGFR